MRENEAKEGYEIEGAQRQRETEVDRAAFVLTIRQPVQPSSNQTFSGTFYVTRHDAQYSGAILWICHPIIPASM